MLPPFMYPMSVTAETTNSTAKVPASPVSPTTVADTHPSQRWETAFIYAFVCKFTKLKDTIEGLENPMSFEQALLSPGADPVIVAILAVFVVNLKNTIRDAKSRAEKHVANVVNEYLAVPTERSIWWSDTERRNVNPLTETDGFFSLSWDKKLSILRQLVEWQLSHNVRIKEVIDTAWGVKAAKHQKKIDKEANAPPPTDHPQSMENLRMTPVGQDSSKKRYWVVDNSPRLYMSGNPWKSSCAFQSVCSTRDEFVTIVEDLKKRAPEVPTDEKLLKKAAKSRTRSEQAHLDLIHKLETEQLPKIDEDIARVARARKKFEQKLLLAAQVDVRTTRTRRQARKPDYVYEFDQEAGSGENDDEYADRSQDNDDFLDDGDIDMDDGAGSGYAGSSISGSRRRSSRSVVVKGRKPVVEPPFGNYRGERRSTRLGNAPAIAFDDNELALLPSTSTTQIQRSNLVQDDANGGSSLSGNGAHDDPLSNQHRDASAAGLDDSLDPAPTPKKKRAKKFWYYEPVPGTGADSGPSSVPPPENRGGGIANTATSNGDSSAPTQISNGTNGVHTAEAGLEAGMEGIELTSATHSVAGEELSKISANGMIGAPARDSDNVLAGNQPSQAPARASSAQSDAMEMSDEDS